MKSVAKKLAEDVDNLKNTAGTMGRVSDINYKTALIFCTLLIVVVTIQCLYILCD